MFFSSVSLQDWDSPGTISLYPVQTGFSDSFSTIVTASCFTLVEFCWCWRERSSSRKVPLSVFTMFGDLESSAITYSTKKNNTMKLEAICDVKKAQELLNYVPEFLSQQNCTTNGNHEKKLEKNVLANCANPRNSSSSTRKDLFHTLVISINSMMKFIYSVIDHWR